MAGRPITARNGTGVLLGLLVIAAVTGAVLSMAGPAEYVAGSGRPMGPNPCVGTITDPPENTTLLSVQGARGSQKTVAMVVGIRPNGSIIGVHNASQHGRRWAYDIDLLFDGSLLFSSTEPGISIVEELDPKTGKAVEVWSFPEVLDSHDADRINGDELLMNDMSQNGEARIFVYNLTRAEIVWEYRFADHPNQFPRAGGGEFLKDWTHNNDVEQIGDGLFMVSVRNFDQVVAINRSTKEIEWTLGEDGNHDILFEQHNPDFLQGRQGRSAVLVADSRNDRVVEYTGANGTWRRSWILHGGGLNEPRDADRLPNGNTLVVDRRGHRLLEVTPTGEVVWEIYAPYQPYDAERVGTGDESAGPTMAELGTTGRFRLTGGRGVDSRRTAACYDFLTSVSTDRFLETRESVRMSPSLVDADDLRGEAPGETTLAEPANTTLWLLGLGLVATLLGALRWLISRL